MYVWMCVCLCLCTWSLNKMHFSPMSCSRWSRCIILVLMLSYAFGFLGDFSFHFIPLPLVTQELTVHISLTFGLLMRFCNFRAQRKPLDLWVFYLIIPSTLTPRLFKHVRLVQPLLVERLYQMFFSFNFFFVFISLT